MTDSTARTALQVALDLHQPHALGKSVAQATAEELAAHKAKNQARASLMNDSWSHKVAAFRAQNRRDNQGLHLPLDSERLSTHSRIIEQEWNEFWNKGVFADDILETLDGGLDLIYTVLDFLISRGFPPHVIDAAMEEIHASNMTKADENGDPIINGVTLNALAHGLGAGYFNPNEAIGKVLKGPRYTPANLPLAAFKATPSFYLLPEGEAV